MRILIIAACGLLGVYVAGVAFVLGARLNWWTSPMDYVSNGPRAHELGRS